MANIIRFGGGSGSAVLTTKNITQNGTYYASADNADGYSSVDVNVSGGGSFPYLCGLNMAQGGAWVNTGVDMTSIDNVIFRNVVSGAEGLIKQIAKTDIAVYTGGQDVFTTIFSANAIGKAFNIRIYNNYLYVSFNGTGAATNIVKAYNGTIQFGADS